MKKIVIAFSVLAAIAACGGGKADGDKKSSGTDITQNPDYQKGLALIGKSDCLTCHKIDEQLTGPSYKQVAEKYAGASPEKISQLAQTIIAGGKGNWGEAFMTPHADLSQADAEAMVKYILLLKN